MVRYIDGQRTPEDPVISRPMRDRIIPADAVVVSENGFASDDSYDIVYSNITFVNALLEVGVAVEDISADGLRSYYVDFYRGEVSNGGFAQFVRNSRWNAVVNASVRGGLAAVGADHMLSLFTEMGTLVEELGPARLETFLSSDLFGVNVERDELNVLNKRFVALADDEDMVGLNATWLRGLPNLVVLSIDEMFAEIERREGVVSGNNL